jgi:hypothetical protein
VENIELLWHSFLKSLKRASHEAVPKGYFPSSFIHEASGEVVSGLHWRGEAGNRSFAQLLSQAHVSPNDFENSFSFTREVASGAVLREAEAMPNGAII